MRRSLDSFSSEQGTEGFEAQIPIIEEMVSHVLHQTKQVRNTRPVDFQPRYICLDGVLKKQAPEVSLVVSEYPIISNTQLTPRTTKKYKKPEHLPTCSEIYLQSSKFKLVYRRSKKMQQQKLFNQDFGHRQIKLSNLCGYNSADYSILKPHQQQLVQIEDHLIFDSKFQCGNLSCAFKNMVFPNQYDLFMQNDTNTHGYTQWFYFSVKGLKRNVTYRFNIVNFVTFCQQRQRKKHSFFKSRMMPAVFSFKRYQRTKQGWSREGKNIIYQKSDFAFKQGNSTYAYTLSFDLSTEEQFDTLLIAVVPPYSYSRLIQFLKQKEKQYLDHHQVSYNVIPFYNTISNNSVPLIQISAKKQQVRLKQKEKVDYQKRIIMIVARQHPGQIWPSFIAQYLLEMIPEQFDLLEKYRFVVVPMVNVDGVIYGNFRCDISGDDLNRQWTDPSKQLHPHIYQIKSYIEALSDKIDIFLDLHGHSKKLNTFSYCCKLDDQYSCRTLPLILSKLNQGFKIQDCTYGIDKSKSNTLRAFGFRQTSKVNVMTLESSLYGINSISGIQHYQPKHMKNIASNLLDSMRIMLIGSNVQGMSKETIQKESKARISEFMMYDRQNQDDSGSDSDPYIDQLTILQKIKRVLPRNLEIPKSAQKLQRSRKSFRKSSKRNKTGAKNQQDVFYMNLQSTFHVSTPKASKKQNSVKDLITTNVSKKQPSVFVPRVAFLDIASNRKIKQESFLFRNVDCIIGSQMGYNGQKRARPLMHMSKVGIFQQQVQVPSEPVSSLLLGMSTDKCIKLGRRNTRWMRQTSKLEQKSNTYNRLMSRQSNTKSERGIKGSQRYFQGV